MSRAQLDLSEIVSRETIEKIVTYSELLKKWQKAINLVGPDTIADAEERHFLDSAQVVKYIPDNAKALFDIGSGAGFPGLVIAMARPDLDVHLIESDQRKCTFLRNVSRETFTKVTIHNARIEVLCEDSALPVPNVVTARALASLDKLLDYCYPWVVANPDLTIVAMKGAQAEQEVSTAREKYSFDLESHQSLTSAEARILSLSNIKYSGCE